MATLLPKVFNEAVHVSLGGKSHTEQLSNSAARWAGWASHLYHLLVWQISGHFSLLMEIKIA